MLQYQADQKQARDAFAERPALSRILAGKTPAMVLEQFLIHFSAIGVGMTEPVEGWIRRAGERCSELGMTSLGRALVKHAAHEANHHVMMIADTHKLMTRWNERHRDSRSADELLSRALMPSVQSYRDLHDQVVNGPAPFAQVAIEYEIERLSVDYGGPLLKQCATQLGPEILSGLSFLEEHVEIDVGHTKFNEVQLSSLLTDHPGSRHALVDAGQRALACYGDFLEDCMQLSLEVVATRGAVQQSA